MPHTSATSRSSPGSRGAYPSCPLLLLLLLLPPPPSSSAFLLRPLLLLSLLPRHLLICPRPTRSGCCLAGSNWPLRSSLGPRPSQYSCMRTWPLSSRPRRLAPHAHHPSLLAAEREDQAPFMVRGKSVSGRPRIDGGSVRVPAEFVDTHRICGRICGAKFVGK